MQPVLRSRRAIDDRTARRRGAIVGRATRSGLSLLSLSLWSGLSLLSLSLSLFPEVIWSENEGRKWFPGQRWKYWSIGSHFPENDIFRDSQTCGKGWKWFPEIIFTQNKRTLSRLRTGWIAQPRLLERWVSICWGIWKSRNEVRVGGKRRPGRVIVRSALKVLGDFLTVSEKPHRQSLGS